MTKLRYSRHIQYKTINIMSKFDILRKRFNQIPVGEKFDFMDLINDLVIHIQQFWDIEVILKLEVIWKG